MLGESGLGLLWEARRTRRRGLQEAQRRQRARLAEAVAFARAHSPYYRQLYRAVPERVEDTAVLPVTSKETLMARFDDWVTDPDVTLEAVRSFLDDADLIGQRFRGKYTLTTTSGTTGTRGIFVLDHRSMAVTKAMAARMLGAWLRGGDLVRILAGGARVAMIAASGGHFMTAVAAARLPRRGPAAAMARAFSVHTPLPELVAGLNRFRPAVLAPYASIAALLATEQEAGRLRIDPALLVLSAEGLPISEYDRIRRVFNAKVGHSYAATECPFLSYSCAHDWLHVNIDWVAFEPVDADHRPTPVGERSHTVLISNLANRVQPVLRYDLGDAVVQRPDPCPCGDPLPAIRVQGRAADVLTFPAGGGGQITVAPLALATLVDRTAGVELFQIVQTAPTTLRVRLRPAAGENPDQVWRAVHTQIKRLLAEHNLDHVALQRADEPPQRSPGGKHRNIIPLTRAS